MNNDEIMNALKKHHDYVIKKHKDVVMTVLCGSQNYEIDHENSDIDTFSFILPSIAEISQLKEPVSYEFEVEDGKCTVKDMRLALNLLIKTSPNSIEWFASRYQYWSPEYAEILSKYLNNETMNKMIRCDYIHMMKACMGLTHQLSKRNMPAGKRYAHALRMISMWNTFVFNDNHILSYRSEDDRIKALNAKLQPDNDYQDEIDKIDNIIHETAPTLLQSIEYKEIEKTACALTRAFEQDLVVHKIKKDIGI